MDTIDPFGIVARTKTLEARINDLVKAALAVRELGPAPQTYCGCEWCSLNAALNALESIEQPPASE